MKRLSLIMLGLTLSVPAIFSQTRTVRTNQEIPVTCIETKPDFSLEYDASRTLTCQDTLSYPFIKQQVLFGPTWASNFTAFEVWEADDEAVSQTFLHTGGSVTINAVEFLGCNSFDYGTANVAVRASVYTVDALNNPVALLGSGTTTISSTTVNFHIVPLAVPVTITTGNYAIVLEATNANGVLEFWGNSGNPGEVMDENLSRYISDYYPESNGSWISMPTLFAGAADFEPIVAPIVTYNINTNFTVTPNPVCVGTPINITNITTNAAMLSNRFYTYGAFENYFSAATVHDSVYVWDMDNSVAGPYIWNTNTSYTYPTAGTFNAQMFTLGGLWSNCLDNFVVPVVVNPADNATFSYTPSTLCVGSPNPTPTEAAIGTYSATPAGLNFVSTTTGQINVATSTPGTYTVTHTTSGPCTATSTQTFTITALDNATFAYTNNTLCAGAPNSTPSVSVAGTFSSSPAGLNFVSTTTGEIDMTTSTNGTYTVTYTTSGSCPNSSTQTFTITTAPDAAFTYASTAYCADETDPVVTLGVGASAGTYSSTAGLVINSGTGTIDLSASTPGTYLVTNSIAASGTCPATSDDFTVTINGLPSISFSPADLCEDAAPVTLSATPAGGTFSGTGVSAGQFDPGVGSQNVTYTYTDANGCSNFATELITVNSLPAITFTPSSVCQGSGLVTLTATPAGGAFTGTGVSAGQFDPSVGTQTVTYTYTDASSCSNTANALITVNTLPTVTFTGTTACSADAAITLNGSPAGGTYTGTGVAGDQFNPSAGTQNLTYTYTDANGCSSTANATITVNPTPNVTLGSLGNSCIYHPDFALTGGTPAGGTYSGTGVTAGQFSPATAGLGTHVITYTVTASGCTGSDDINLVVDACLGIEDETNNTVSIFPNPATELVTFQFAGDKDIYFNILTTAGQVVYNNIFQSNQAVVDLSELAPAVYFVHVTINGKTSTAKLIVQ